MTMSQRKARLMVAFVTKQLPSGGCFGPDGVVYDALKACSPGISATSKTWWLLVDPIRIACAVPKAEGAVIKMTRS